MNVRFLAYLYYYRWKFTRTLLADGNFKQDHLAMKKGSDDVSLNDGLGYFVSRRPFEKYINEAPPVTRQVFLMISLTVSPPNY